MVSAAEMGETHRKTGAKSGARQEAAPGSPQSAPKKMITLKAAVFSRIFPCCSPVHLSGAIKIPRVLPISQAQELDIPHRHFTVSDGSRR
jgi:hypothetical protein